MPVSASVFRRGGPKKELFDVINEDGDDETELDEKLAELDELLHLVKTGRELSAAIWRPTLCAAEVVKQRKNCTRDMGFIRGRKSYLQVEEAVFLFDRGDLLLFVEEEVEAPGGGERRPRQRLLSVQEAFDLMISVGVPLERYLLYTVLSRSGYLVMRHPSRWLLGREEAPEQVWGSGAWAACYGRLPAVPGTVLQPPMQQQLAAARAAAADAAAAAAAATPGPASDAAAAAGDAASPMDVEARDTAAAANSDAAMPAAAAGTATAVAGRHHAGGGMQVPLTPAQQQLRRRQGPGGNGGDAASTGTAAVGSRGWWLAAGPDHPHMRGVPEEFFRQMQPAVVEDRRSKWLRTTYPNLRPLDTIGSVLAAASSPPPPGEVREAAAAAATSGGRGGGGSAAAALDDAALVAADDAALVAAGSGGIWLGTPGADAHLVFDVYKPGRFVSRSKGQFPAVHTHVAMCSAAPPTLGEMRAADAAAAAAATGDGGGGDVGRPASVSWAAVLNGDIALYSIGKADLLQLL